VVGASPGSQLQSLGTIGQHGHVVGHCEHEAHLVSLHQICKVFHAVRTIRDDPATSIDQRGEQGEDAADPVEWADAEQNCLRGEQLRAV